MATYCQTQELLAVYPKLEAQQKMQVDLHLQECEECQATLAAYRVMDQTLRQHSQQKIQWVTAHPVLVEPPTFANFVNASAGHTTWLDDLLFRPFQLRSLTLRLVGAMALLLLIMAFSTLLGGWLPFEQPVMASTPTQAVTQASQAGLPGQMIAITYTPTATPTAISLAATMTPAAIQ